MRSRDAPSGWRDRSSAGAAEPCPRAAPVGAARRDTRGACRSGRRARSESHRQRPGTGGKLGGGPPHAGGTHATGGGRRRTGRRRGPGGRARRVASGGSRSRCGPGTRSPCGHGRRRSTARTPGPAADGSCRRRLAPRRGSTRAADTATARTRSTASAAAPRPSNRGPAGNPWEHRPAIALASGSLGLAGRAAVDGGRDAAPRGSARGRARLSSPASRGHAPYPSKIGPMIANDVYRRWTLGNSSTNIGTSRKAVPESARSRCYVRNVESWRVYRRLHRGARRSLHITDHSTLID